MPAFRAVVGATAGVPEAQAVADDLRCDYWSAQPNGSPNCPRRHANEDGIAVSHALPVVAIAAPGELRVHALDGPVVDLQEAEQAGAVAQREHTVELGIGPVVLIGSQQVAPVGPRPEIGALPEGHLPLA